MYSDVSYEAYDAYNENMRDIEQSVYDDMRDDEYDDKERKGE